MKLIKTLLICIIVISFLTSCSGSNPVVPDKNHDQLIEEQIQISDSSKQIQEDPYRGVLGAWKVAVDLETLTAEIVPARNAKAIGDIFDSDLSQFLTVSPCTNCLMLSGISQPTEGKIHLDIRIKHPFGDIDSRPDLHGFDVRAIFIGPSTFIYESEIKIMMPDGIQEDAAYPVSYLYLMNAEGMTSHYDNLVNDERYFIHAEDYAGNLNPYLRFFEDRQTPVFDPHAPSGYNVMPVGSSTYKRTAVFSVTRLLDTLEFYLIADVAYGQSATYKNRQNPEYYLPSFNRTEPWRMEYWIENNNLDYTDANSTADIVVQVFDWQHNAFVDVNYPDPANPTGIAESSKVTQVELMFPGLQDNRIITSTPESGSGTPISPLQYRLTVKNENLGGNAGFAFGLLAVRDELHGHAAPSGRSPIPELPAGFPYETEDIQDYSYYGEVVVNVPESSHSDDLYDNEIVVVPETQFERYGTIVEAFFLMDPSQIMFQYKWDYDYDGVTFDEDGSGLPSPEIDYSTGGKKNAALRVRTNAKPPREYLYEIPIFSEGEEFKSNVDSSGFWIASSHQGNSAVGMSSEYYYVAYVTGSTTKRNIQLAVIDHQGNATIHNVTDTTVYDSAEPAIVVVEDGINDGVYVAFISFELGFPDIYFNHGNLDGSGFEQANVEQITSNGAAISSYPSMIYIGENLCVYYYHNFALNHQIYAAYSENLGYTWNIEGAIDPTGNIQIFPAVTLSQYNYVNCVWSDGRNDTTRGSDLYLARSSNGYTFYPSKNISSAIGKIHEQIPSIASFEDTLGIAYLQQVDGDANMDAWLKIINTHDDTVIDYLVTPSSGGYIQTTPAIGTDAWGNFIYACGSYDDVSTELTAHIMTIKASSGFGYFYEQDILTESLGTIDAAGSGIFPGIVSRRGINGNAVENFITWKRYPNGSHLSNTPFPEYFGNIGAISYVTEGDMN